MRVDKFRSTAAKRAGRQVMIRYAFTLVGLVVGLALLAGVALFVQYRRLDEQSAQALKATVEGRSALLSTRAAAAIQQVKRARNSMEIAMDDADLVAPEISSQLQRINDAEQAQKPLGTYWSADTRTPMQRVEILGNRQLPNSLNET